VDDLLRAADKRFVLVSLLLALVVVRFPNERPAFTDAYYHFNAAVKLAEGAGFVDHYLWTFVAAPDALPARSHLYWMPGTSLLAAAGMTIFGVSFWGGAGRLLALPLGGSAADVSSGAQRRRQPAPSVGGRPGGAVWWFLRALLGHD
jgi:hypothetical protein